MNDKESRWGTAAWFDSLYLGQENGSPTAYFSYDKKGYQKYRHDRLVGLVSSQIGIFKSGAELVDIGCATGHLTHSISTILGAKRVIGVDFSPELLKGAKNNFPHILFLLGGLPTLPLEHGVADVISLIEVLYYVDKDKRADSIAECSRLLRPGGILIFAANVQGQPYLTPKEVVELLTGINFKIEKVFAESYGVAVFVERLLIGAHRFFRRVLNRDAVNDSKIRRFSRILPYLRNPAGRLMAQFWTTCIDHLISYKTFFGILVFLNCIIPGKRASHFIVFASKT